jgi:hypothetical protein
MVWFHLLGLMSFSAGGHLLRLLGHVHTVAHLPCRSGSHTERLKPGVSH